MTGLIKSLKKNTPAREILRGGGIRVALKHSLGVNAQKRRFDDGDDGVGDGNESANKSALFQLSQHAAVYCTKLIQKALSNLIFFSVRKEEHKYIFQKCVLHVVTKI